MKKGGVLSAVTVGKRTGISENDQLAFLRAMGVKHYLVEHIPSLNAMKVNYETNIDISDKRVVSFDALAWCLLLSMLFDVGGGPSGSSKKMDFYFLKF